MDPGPHNLAYDPDQDPEEKRDVRKKYRAFQKTTEGALQHFGSFDAKKLMLILIS
jgi:hypothetical protein